MRFGNRLEKEAKGEERRRDGDEDDRQIATARRATAPSPLSTRPPQPFSSPPPGVRPSRNARASSPRRRHYARNQSSRFQP